MPKAQKKTKRLHRSKNKLIAGVAAGVAEYLDIDPTVMRLIWALLTIVSAGVGIIAYIAAWIIIPEKK
jgi:phage shock protein PspC (stress-responsive transcriptional regulator)